MLVELTMAMVIKGEVEGKRGQSVTCPLVGGFTFVAWGDFGS